MMKDKLTIKTDMTADKERELILTILFNLYGRSFGTPKLFELLKSQGIEVTLNES